MFRKPVQTKCESVVFCTHDKDFQHGRSGPDESSDNFRHVARRGGGSPEDTPRNVGQQAYVPVGLNQLTS
jgi:hypothetical protein